MTENQPVEQNCTVDNHTVEDEQLINEFERILDELTLSNFFLKRDEILFSIEPNIKNEWSLRKCLALIEQKAKDNLINSVAYAQLLKELLHVAVINKDGFVLTMQKLLNSKITACYTEMKMPDEYEHEKYKETIGKARFIGELYKCKLLTKHDLLLCLRNFYVNKSNCFAHCLVILLTVVGKQLILTNEPLVEEYFNYLASIFDNNAEIEGSDCVR